MRCLEIGCFTCLTRRHGLRKVVFKFGIDAVVLPALRLHVVQLPLLLQRGTRTRAGRGAAPKLRRAAPHLRRRRLGRRHLGGEGGGRLAAGLREEGPRG